MIFYKQPLYIKTFTISQLVLFNLFITCRNRARMVGNSSTFRPTAVVVHYSVFSTNWSILSSTETRLESFHTSTIMHNFNASAVCLTVIGISVPVFSAHWVVNFTTQARGSLTALCTLPHIFLLASRDRETHLLAITSHCFARAYSKASSCITMIQALMSFCATYDITSWFSCSCSGMVEAQYQSRNKTTSSNSAEAWFVGALLAARGSAEASPLAAPASFASGRSLQRRLACRSHDLQTALAGSVSAARYACFPAIRR